MGIPSTADIRAYLEGYGLDTTAIYSLTGNLTLNSAVVTNIDTRNLKPQMLVQGTHIPALARILTVDAVAIAGQITLDSMATANATGEALTITYYPFLSDDWIIKKRDKDIITWVEKICNTSFSATRQIEEFYSGNGSSVLVLNRKPIVSLDSVSYTNVIADQFVIQIQAIQVIAEEGILKVRTNFNETTWIPIFPRGLENMRIKYTYGYATMPDDIAEAVKYLVCERALALVGARTGGGSITVKDFSRDFGDIGKYTDIRKELAHDAYKILRNYFSAAIGVG